MQRLCYQWNGIKSPLSSLTIHSIEIELEEPFALQTVLTKQDPPRLH